MGEIADMLAEFHAAVSHPETDALWTRKTLHREEYEELSDGLQALEMVRSGDAAFMLLGGRDLSGLSERAALEDVARELADVVYVAYGTALALGIDLEVALGEVHRANMSKVDGPRRADGKVLKPDGFVAPDMSAAIESGRRSA
jgi:predicted HAD superfamily Cof-like phosphohydrolase